MNRLLTIALVLSVTSVAVGCTTRTFKVGSPWNPDEARFFDDGVDMVKDLESLSGKWAFQQEQELDGRVQLADLIAQVMVLSVQTLADIDGFRTTAKRVYVKVLHGFHGMVPEEKFYLVSSTEAPGYEYLGRYERHLNGRFIVFIRWYEDEGGKRAHHFHLSPNSPGIIAAVEKRVVRRQAEEEAAALRGEGY